METRSSSADRWQLQLRRRHAGASAAGSFRDSTWNQRTKWEDNTDVITDPELDTPSSQVPRVAHYQVWMDHTGTRLSKHCKRTPIFTKTERPRLHAMERSPFRAVPTLPTSGQEAIEEKEYRRYFRRLDQLSDTQCTRLTEGLSMLRGCAEVSSA